MNEKVLIIIPTYNEAHNIKNIIGEVFIHLPLANVLIVDDSSPDGTLEIVKSLYAHNDKVRFIQRPGKLGLRSAYQEGYRYGIKNNFDYIIQMDADFSHHPRYLPLILAEAEHADLVLGSRYAMGGGTKGWSFLRRFISRGGTFYAKKILGLPYSDLTAGFKCFTPHTLNTINFESLKSNGYAFQLETIWRAHQKKLRIAEIPIVVENRVKGKSKMSWAILQEAIWRVWQFKLQSFSKPRT